MPVTVYKGKHALFRLRLTDAKQAHVDPADFEAISFTAKLAVTGDDVAILFEKTLGDGVAVVEEEGENCLDLAVEPADTEEIAMGEAEQVELVYDVQGVTETGKVKVLVEPDLLLLKLPVKRGTPGEEPPPPP